MDYLTAWCIECGRSCPEGNSAYCSDSCRDADLARAAAKHSLYCDSDGFAPSPIHAPAHASHAPKALLTNVFRSARTSPRSTLPLPSLPLPLSSPLPPLPPLPTSSFPTATSTPTTTSFPHLHLVSNTGKRRTWCLRDPVPPGVFAELQRAVVAGWDEGDVRVEMIAAELCEAALAGDLSLSAGSDARWSSSQSSSLSQSSMSTSTSSSAKLRAKMPVPGIADAPRKLRAVVGREQ
ncbi:hypothetical protein M427DRAFT_136833 [Gonapodya prolifera JEL478]|uniref:Uncharacterized protein n=1 Tax=Gonapodya prolifera (strain JEL478) TaxID=1344416 RepID=A0A139A8E4_GONPJ|nr:hypothetical protein M427DRAFT_136833 [Gonapodya prolifera JEL478]|eukprot:KXS13076.1 hypothetical protein M427DRAFT_136833 [Gonapodya prolifera JEL478]